MRLALPSVALLLASSLLAGCQMASPAPTANPTSEPILASLPARTLVESAGTAHEALGLYWLDRDAASPLEASLTMARQTAAQGDLFALSVRPFMTPQSLRIIGTAPAPGNATDYEVRFTHPFAMPEDLERPHSATKRVDLFLFDVQTVLVTPGTDLFFGGTVRTNLQAMPVADGYRQLGPLVDLETLGITDGTNTFPYQVLSNASDSAPRGNYSISQAWSNHWLNPTGYDVVPQGGTAFATLRVNNDLAGPVGVVVVAKYMDPRLGTTAQEKRQNRLPDPENLAATRYYLPEAAGDLQKLSVTVQGEVHESRGDDTATITARILDWDHAASMAGSFPDPSQPTAISELSQPAQIQASFPDLLVDGTFPGTTGASSGLIDQYIDVTIPVQNLDRTLVVPSDAGLDVQGLIRVLDTQDLSAPVPVLLDESLQSTTPVPGFFPSTRYQAVRVHVRKDNAPQVTSVQPLTGRPGASVQISASVINGPVTSWAWNFGTGATPPTSALSSPLVTLGEEGEHAGSVTVGNAQGETTFEFVLRPALPVPTLPPTPFNYANQPLPRHYTDLNYPAFGPVAQSDNTPPTNPITDAGATLGRVLFYDTRLSANNTVSCASCHQQANGFSDPLPRSIGFTGGQTGRHSMSLANVRYYDNGRMFWDERAATLEIQALTPIQDEVEMGMTLPALEAKLARASFYGPLFQAAFGDPSITSDRIGRALAQFMRSMVSYRSKYDQAVSAGPNGLPDFPAVFDEEEMLGLAVFQGFPGITAPNMACNTCHATVGMTIGQAGAPPPGPPPGPFAVNNGLDLVTGTDPGAGQGRFKSPSLRNIARTAPYMHDGRFPNLDAVVTFYSQGVQPHPNLHPLLREGNQPGNPPERFNLTPQERAGLIAFLNTLTDEAFLTDPKFSSPFTD